MVYLQLAETRGGSGTKQTPWWLTHCQAGLDDIIYAGHSELGGNERCVESSLVYPAPDGPLPAATAIITLKECGTLVLNSLWPPWCRRSGGGRSLQGWWVWGCVWVTKVSGCGVCLCWGPEDTPPPLHPWSCSQLWWLQDPQHGKQNLHGVFAE